MTTTWEEYKAWSQNLGHEHMLTTFTSYGPLSPHRQAELIRRLGRPAVTSSNDDLAASLEALLASLKRA